MPRVLCGVLQRGEQGDETEAVDGLRPGLEKPGFKKKTQPSVFFLGFYGFFLYICPEKRGVLGFFQFQEYF